MKELDKGVVKKIYAILIKYAGADRKDEEDFIYRVMDGCQEYRFCGYLGVGGKFFASNCTWWVSGYKEDQTAASRIKADRTNHELKILRGSLDPLGSLACALHKRYSHKYKNRFVAIDAETGFFAPRLYLVFRYANGPYKPYLQVVFRDNIRITTNVGSGMAYIERGMVSYEDPAMLEKLDAIIDRIVTTTPRLKQEPNIGD